MYYFLIEKILLFSKPKTYLKLIINFKIINKLLSKRFKNKWIIHKQYEEKIPSLNIRYYQTYLNGLIYKNELIILYSSITYKIIEIYIIEHNKQNNYYLLFNNLNSIKFYYKSINDINLLYKFIKSCEYNDMLNVLENSEKILIEYYLCKKDNYYINNLTKQKELNWPILLDLKNKKFIYNLEFQYN